MIGCAMPDAPDSAYALALETSGDMGSVALGRGAEVLETRLLGGPRRHAVEFLPTVAAICKAHAVEPATIRRVYVSSGPGSFTGLRIGITAARMIALAGGASVIAVPTLEVIAQNAALAAGEPLGLKPSACSVPPDRVVVVLDAKRGRVYAAAFVRRDNGYAATGDPVEADPVSFLASQAAQGQSCAVLGEGIRYHLKAVEASGWPILPESLYRPRAETVYRLGLARAGEGRFDDRRTLVPTYVRPPEAEERWEQRQTNRGGEKSACGGSHQRDLLG